jgi:hypothetical protein
MLGVSFALLRTLRLVPAPEKVEAAAELPARELPAPRLHQQAA